MTPFISSLFGAWISETHSISAAVGENRASPARQEDCLRLSAE